MPNWLIPLIAAGTLIAAIISAIIAIAVALINARSARQLAIDAAHRQYREAACRAIVEYGRAVSGVAEAVLRATVENLSADALRDRLEAWRRELRNIDIPVKALRVDPLLSRALDEHGAATFHFRVELDEPDVDEPAEVQMERLVTRAGFVLAATEAVESAAEGYVFGVSSATKRARKQLDDFSTRWGADLAERLNRQASRRRIADGR